MPEEETQNQIQLDKSDETEELRKNLEVCEKAKNELIELSQRLKADFINYKKDQDKTMALARQYANEVLLLMFLPILDSLEKAMEHIPPELEQNQWAQGIKNIKNQISGALKNIGVSEISALDEKFDPYLHEAIAQVESDQDDETVLEEFQKGYKFHDRILRPAKVKISIKKH